MLKIKIFTASTEKPANEAFDRLAETVEQFMNVHTNARVEWLQSSQGEYSVRLTAIINYLEMT